jgi:predicted dehydrogenase
MSQPLEAVILGAGDRGHYCHGMFAQRYPHKLRIVGIAEPNPVLRDRFGDLHQLPPERRFASWEDLIAAGQLAPVLMNTTPDRVHAASTMAALKAGYHVLLEKPIATSPEECVQIVETAEQCGRMLQIHHGMRYAPFQTMIHEILASGRIGQIMDYNHRENIAFFHFAHAYVRGNWRRKETSGPVILTKCCHDLDLIVWYTGSRCKRLVSSGSLRYYRPENARPDYPERCTDGCPAEAECPYFAPRLYITDPIISGMFAQAITVDLSKEGILKALKTGPYGKCVFHCDNDVADNQVTLLEMEDGTNVTLSMHGFSHDGGRSIRFQGTRATLMGETLERSMTIHDHLTARQDVLHVGKTTGGHGGGDDGLISAFIQSVQTGHQDPASTGRVALESHLMAFAAEESRLTGQPVEMAAYRKAVEDRAKLNVV